MAKTESQRSDFGTFVLSKIISPTISLEIFGLLFLVCVCGGDEGSADIFFGLHKITGILKRFCTFFLHILPVEDQRRCPIELV